MDKINYKFNEGEILKQIEDYVNATYEQHYAINKFQATEFIIDADHGTGFCVGNVMKYAQRYGKKGTAEDWRKDMMKVIHYAMIQLYVHDLGMKGSSEEIKPADKPITVGLATNTLSAIYDSLSGDFDLSGNRVKNGIETGGSMRNGEMFIDKYLSYKSDFGWIANITILQYTRDSSPRVEVMLTEVEGYKFVNHEYPFSQIDEAVEKFYGLMQNIVL